MTGSGEEILKMYYGKAVPGLRDKISSCCMRYIQPTYHAREHSASHFNKLFHKLKYWKVANTKRSSSLKNAKE